MGSTMAQDKQAYDFLVIGGGSGGLGCARRAAAYGAKVCVFENNRLGGTCVNVGCVPKKVMFLTANMAETLHDAKGYGFDFSEPTFDFPRLKKQRDEYIKFLNGIYSRNLERDNVDCV